MGKLAAAGFLTLAGCLATAPAASQETLVDRVVAAVDGDPILLSDIRRVLELGLAEARPGESEEELQRRVLDGLIEQRLRFHEVERYDPGALPVDLLERRLDEIRAGFPDRSAFERHLVELGIAEEELRHLLARQLRILLYLEERLAPRVFVHPEDVRAYYEEELVPRMVAEGGTAPPLGEVREEIRALLRQERLNREIEAWSEELRRQAEVFDFLERPEREPPPVVRRLEID